LFGNDAATKGYVDSLVGQYSGCFNLFMNRSDGSLSTIASSAAQQHVDVEVVEAVQGVATPLIL
jgi:hypothetical protein